VRPARVARHAECGILGYRQNGRPFHHGDRVNISRRQITLASALLVFLAVSTLSCLDFLLNQERVSPDFKSFYAASKAASERRNFYDARDLREVARAADVPGRVWPYLYPPFFASVAQPLAALTVQRAQWLWSLASIVAMGLVAMLSLLISDSSSRKEQGERQLLKMGLLGLLLLLVLPLRNNVMIGQINILVLLFITLAFYAYLRGFDLLAGASLGIAVMIKVSPAILVFLFLARRRYRALAGLTISLLACVGISMAMGAASAWAEYPAFMLERMSANEIPALGRVDVIWNFSLKAFFLRLLPENPTLAPLLAAASALGILCMLIYASIRTREVAGSDEVLMLGFLAFMVVASPLSYVHHVIFLFPGVVLAWGRMSRSAIPQRVKNGFLLSICILVCLVSCDFPAIVKEAGLPEALSSVNLFALLGLLLLSLLAARLLWRREVAHEASTSAPRGGC